jgi:hypothetical protein
MSNAPCVFAQNVLSEKIKVFAGFPWDGKWAWGIKFLTKNCDQCLHCIGKEEAVRVVKMVNVNKGKIRWEPPKEESIAGVCNRLPEYPKILFQPEKPRKCEFFGKPPK